MNQKKQKETESNIDIFRLLSDGIKSYEQKGLNLKLKEKSSNTKLPYCLYEDLKIIFEFSQNSESKLTVFKQLASNQLSHRSEDSIRSRYRDFIQELNPSDFQNISKYVIEKRSIEGYLVKERDEHGNKTYVVKDQLKTTSSESKSQKNPSKKTVEQQQSKSKEEIKLPLKRKPENVPEILINGKKQLKSTKPDNHQKEPAQKIKQQDQNNLEEEEEKEFQYKKTQKNKSQINQVNEVDSRNKKNQNNQMEVQQPQPKQNQQQQQQAQAHKISNQLSEQEYKDARELDVYIHFLANYENVQKKSLIHTLDKLSGDFNQLVDYLQTQNHNLLWKEDEDEVLRNFSEQSSQTIYLLKTLKKGKENILRRATYLGIELPDFE
ncbi:hypothetical protein TTHERM_00013120 (macronuclear) [Tetrahymena thermophila SB210]|uniref:Uncharacterized protein n=2 Tax=Tetrahymena thermophila TaxID=5911 RepID=Q22RS6_TETTS|nr:hypothetical protein TTHERM_00013120 [Tetrahymena thermophila SB210]AIT58613.1 Pat1 [Tetrahymena thermophila]EAR88046.1 hypothetical protein TTHERM_00013120 [Tetrahymena thermophila SB210]|eukprot:XP_001008291.1 hypothetical protein TTHERM_00013120 [Tetrahymena thermophila SB210]